MTELRTQKLQGIISEDNSTATPLGIGGVFTGDWVEILNYGIVFINVYSDQASATDGLMIQQSSDGINADHDDVFTIAAGIGKNYSINPFARYLRVIYTNGTVAQTEFRLQTIIKGNSKPSSHRLQDDITVDDDAELQIAVLKVQTNDEYTYKNVSVQNPMPTNGDSVYAKDLDLAESDYTGWTAVNNGELQCLFSDITKGLTYTGATNPKNLTIAFQRPVTTTGGMGLVTTTGNFSNVKLIAVQADGTESTLVDYSSDNTDRTILPLQFAPTGFTSIRLEFHTADDVTLTNIFIPKAATTISRLQALKPDGTVTNIGATNYDNLKVSVQEYGDTPSIDAFDRLRVSNPYTIFDSKLTHDSAPLFWNQEIGGSGAINYNSNNAASELTVTASASDYVIDQTKQRFNYQPGKSQLMLMTFLAEQETGITKRIGLFSTDTSSPYYAPENGIFLEVNAGSVYLKIAKNGSVTESIEQANWNVDPLDGTGDSGITLDFDDVQILIIDFEWLGVGRVRAGFVIDGLIYYTHYFNHANNGFSSVYMQTPNLPLTYTIASDGSGAGKLDHICSSAMSEGGLEQTGVLRSVDTGFTHVDADTVDTTYAVVGIRLKSTHLDVSVFPEFFSMMAETADSFRWSLCLNPTIAGTFTYGDLSNSAIQYATGATANTVSSEGIRIDSGYVPSGSVASGGSGDRKFVTSLRIGSLIDGTRDELVLCVTPLGASADIQGSLTFRELL